MTAPIVAADGVPGLRRRRKLRLVQELVDWWDGVELWITQLWFPFQVALVIVVLLPLCWAAALLIDRAVDRVSAVLPRRRRP